MLKKRLSLVTAIVAVAILGSSALAVAASRAFTIKGQVVDPTGRPVVGAPLQISPLTPDQGWDLQNLYYKIPNYDFHRTTTDRNGEYAMRNVIDYPENRAKYYVVSAPVGYDGLHIRQIVSLKSASDVITLDLKAQYASQAVVTLTDRDGKPFTGRRALYIQTGRRLGDARFGASFVLDSEFSGGVFKYWMPVKDDRYARISVLNYDTATEAKKALAARGLKAGDSLDPLALVMRDAKGRALDVEMSLTPQGEAHFDFQLP